MRKSRDNGYASSLADDMRAWSDGCRGSTAIKAHSDVIICQEMVKKEMTQVVYLGNS